MAPENSIREMPFRPQLLRFIIALFLVKSKPANKSVRDYLTQLRPWIERGGRPDPSADVHSHLDTLGFWKDAYKKSEETVVELQAKVFELERRYEKQMSPVSMNTGLQRKRKSSLAGVGESLSCRPSKQARTTTSATAPQDENVSLPLLLGDGDSSPLDTYTTILLHNIYILQQLRSHQRPPAQELATILLKISIDIDQMISTVAQSVVTANPSVDTCNGATRVQERTMAEAQIAMDSKLDTRLLATSRIFPWVLESIDLLDHTPAGKGFQSQVVYSYITLFRNLLEHICDLAASQYKHGVSKVTQKGKNNGAQTSIQTPQPLAPSTPNNRTTTKICHLLVTMTASLEPTKQTHQDILDGFLSFLLSRVGQLLSLFVFSNPLIRDAKKTSPVERNSTEESKSQAPYLIYILSRLKPLAARPSPSFLAEKARAKLQHTLLKAVFAGQTEEFVEALREPCDPGFNLNVNKAVDVLEVAGRVSGNMGDWYKSEVWRIVGWDVLIKHIEWPDEVTER